MIRMERRNIFVDQVISCNNSTGIVHLWKKKHNFMVSGPQLISGGSLVSPFCGCIACIILQRSYSLTTIPVIILNPLEKIWQATKQESWKKKHYANLTSRFHKLRAPSIVNEKVLIL